jgi:ParB family protein of integrating conjugative element (PFGI_1 class)
MMSQEEMLLTEVSVDGEAPGASQRSRPGSELNNALRTLHPNQILPYDRNPRQQRNPAYDSLKASIRARGFEGILVVTKRPGDNRYMLAAGGNTSLAIIRELLEEIPDDPRWQSLRVLETKWPGEAAVLAAHLIENDARGEISFWDKACGVSTLKAEIEKANGRLLSAAELHREAERMGAKYGVRTIQYLLFAVENLAPIGPWLTFSAVRDTLGPALQSLRGLADLFKIPDAAFRAKRQETLELCATVLHSQQVQSPTGQVELDVQDVLNSLHEATAQLIGTDTRQLAQMLSARTTHPRMTAAQLREVTGATAPASSGELPIPSPASGRQATEKSTCPEDRIPGASVVAPHVQLPLGAMLAAVARSASAPSPAPASAEPSKMDPTDPRHAPGTVNAILLDIANGAELDDLLWQCDNMPLGYYVELPEAGIETRMDGQPVKNSLLRQAAWHVLAALSGQYDRRLVAGLPDDSSWKQLIGDGGFAGQFELQVHGHIHAGTSHLRVDHLHRFMWDPDLGQLFLQLWSWALHWKEAEPARFPKLNATLPV